MLEKSFILFFIAMLFGSCTIVGLTSDYKKLNSKEQEIIKNYDNNRELKNNFVYQINGKQLLNELKKYDKAMVYIFTNYCTSSTSYPLPSFVKYAEDNELTLFLVMDGYYGLNESLQYQISYPFYSIDHKYYKTNIRNSYTNKFLKDLFIEEQNSKDILKKKNDYIYLFEFGKLIKTVDDLKSLYSHNENYN